MQLRRSKFGAPASEQASRDRLVIPENLGDVLSGMGGIGRGCFAADVTGSSIAAPDDDVEVLLPVPPLAVSVT